MASQTVTIDISSASSESVQRNSKTAKRLTGPSYQTKKLLLEACVFDQLRVVSADRGAVRVFGYLRILGAENVRHRMAKLAEIMLPSSAL